MAANFEDELEIERMMEVIRLLKLALGHCLSYVEELRAVRERSVPRDRSD